LKIVNENRDNGVIMNIGYLSTIYHTSILMKNHFKQIGSESLNWKLYPTGPAMIKGFSESEIDMGYIGLPPVIIGIENGLKLKCIAGGHVEGTVMVAPESFKEYSEKYSEIKDMDTIINQFKGKKIGLPSRGSIHDVIMREIVRNASLENEVMIKNYSWPDLIPYALEENEIDAAVGTPAMAVTASKVAKTKIIIPPNYLWSYNPSYGIVVKEEILDEKLEFLKKFLGLHEEMCNLLQNQVEKAANIATKELGLNDHDFALETFKISPRYCASLPPEYIESTIKFTPVLKKLGYLNSNLEKGDIFYTRLIEEVHPDPPHY
jgi:NitT/TauT family transport system substrate-binding protein